MYYPTRFAGLAFLASGYCPPLAGFDLKAVLAHQREHVGTELFGYWLYASPLSPSRVSHLTNAHGQLPRRRSREGDRRCPCELCSRVNREPPLTMSTIRPSQLESLLTLWYTSTPDLWKTVLAPSGQLEPWLKKDSKAPLASFVTQDVGRPSPSSLGLTHCLRLVPRRTKRACSQNGAKPAASAPRSSGTRSCPLTSWARTTSVRSLPPLPLPPPLSRLQFTRD